MATEALHLIGGVNQFQWYITTGSPFTGEYYRQAGIATSPVTSNTTTVPSNIVATVGPWASGEGTSTPVSTFSQTPGTYTYYGFLQDKDAGKYWSVGSATVTVRPNKPRRFSWSTTVSRNQPLKITAADWRDLTGLINDLLKYAGESTRSFTYVTKDVTKISADIVNQVINALNTDFGSGLSRVYKNDPITATTFQEIASAYNTARDNA